MGGADGRGGQAWRALTSRSDTSAARRPEPDVPRWLLRLSCLRSSPQPGRLSPAAPEGLAQGSRRGRAGASAALWRAGEGRGRAEGSGRAGPSPKRTAPLPVPPGVGQRPRGRVGTCGPGVGPAGPGARPACRLLHLCCPPRQTDGDPAGTACTVASARRAQLC